MSIQSICGYTLNLSFSLMLIFGSCTTYAQTTDTVAADSTSLQKVKKKDLAGHQLAIGIDLVHPVLNSLVNDRFGYEFEADYYMHNDLYLAAEGGWGGSTVDYSDLKYSTTNNFFRFGFNRSLLTRDRPTDWDMMFIGFRAAVADVNRSPATFTVLDSVWGSRPGTAAGKNFQAIWGELTGGMRVEFVRGLFGGLNGRAKILFNGKSFNDLSPLYIAGYGRGDKNVAFDFNVYISYGIRWKRRNGADATSNPVPVQAIDKQQ
jgi:hypothetical protein